MAGPSPYLEMWRAAPRSTFESFRDQSIELLDAVLRSFAEASRHVLEENGDMPLEMALGEELPAKLRNQLATWAEFWKETPIHRFLPGTKPILISEKMRSRYDSCCFHEVAFNFALGLRIAVRESDLCSAYCSHVIEFTDNDGLVSDYLQSCIAEIRCECAAGIAKWQAETAKLAPNSALAVQQSANEKNKSKIFPKGIPDDTDIVDLAIRIDSARGSDAKYLDIARELTGEKLGDEPRAKKLLARLRMMRRRGQANF